MFCLGRIRRNMQRYGLNPWLELKRSPYRLLATRTSFDTF